MIRPGDLPPPARIDPSRSEARIPAFIWLVGFCIVAASAFLVGGMVSPSPSTTSITSPDGGSDGPLSTLVSALQTPQMMVMVEATRTQTPIPTPTVTPSPKPPPPPTCVTPVPGERCVTLAATEPPPPPPLDCSEVLLTPSVPCVWETTTAGRFSP